MSLVVCPECGGRISSKAVICPKCGFKGDKPNLPISQQYSCEETPQFMIDLNKWNPNRGTLSNLSVNNNENLYKLFGSWEKIQIIIPDIADAIKNLANSENILVADMDKYIRELIKQGKYRFNIDKQGKLLPTIRDSTGIVKQVRLKELSLSPELTQTFNNLSAHIVLAQILSEVQELKDSILSLHIELQNDRLAQAESAWNKLEQAYQTHDTELHKERINCAVDTAIDAKNSLMKSFGLSLKNLQTNKNKLFGGRNEAVIAEEAFQSITAITNMVQIECQANASLGEYDACNQSLDNFRRFITDNELNNRDTILLLNECTETGKQQFVDEFMNLVLKIEKFDLKQKLEDPWKNLFLKEGEDEKNK